MRTLNVWRQLIAVVRCLVAPENPADYWSRRAKGLHDARDHNHVEFGQEVQPAPDPAGVIEAHGRTWRTGPPPHVGWWNASSSPTSSMATEVWRW